MFYLAETFGVEKNLEFFVFFNDITNAWMVMTMEAQQHAKSLPKKQHINT